MSIDRHPDGKPRPQDQTRTSTQLGTGASADNPLSWTDDSTVPPVGHHTLNSADIDLPPLVDGAAKSSAEQPESDYFVEDTRHWLSPSKTMLGRFLKLVQRESKVGSSKRPPLVESTPWFGPAQVTRTHSFDFLTDAAEHFGDVFRFEVFGKTINVVCGDEAKRLARESQSLGLDRRRIFEPFAKATGVEIFSLEGDQHDILRRLVRFGYAKSTIAPFVGRISQSIRTHIADWPSQITLQSHMAEAAMRGLAAAVSPEPLPLDWKRTGAMGEMGMKVTVRHLPGFVMQLPNMKRAIKSAFDAVGPIVSRHRAGATRDDPLPWMIDAFMAAEADGQTLDDFGVRGGVMYALIAAYTYLGRLALFMLIETIRDPRTCAAVRKEVDTAFSQGELDAATLRLMPTLRAVFTETIRRYPLLAGMPYETTREIEVGDYVLGPNEVVLLTTVPSHFSGDHYSNPWSFDADRVRPPRNEHRQRDAFSPWGLPPRSCLAIGLSELVSMTLVANVVHEYDVQIQHRSNSISLLANPLVGPADGQPAKLVRRSEVDRVIDTAALYDERPYVDGSEADLELPEFATRTVSPGEFVYRQSDRATEFYIVLKGHILVSQSMPGSNDWQMSSCGPGEGFGELGILKQAPRCDAAEATDAVELLVVERDTFLRMVADRDEDAMSLASRVKRIFVARSLRRCLEGADLGRLADHDEIELVQFAADDYILRQGESSDFAYIILSGSVEVLSRSGDREIPLATLTRGDVFGEIGVVEQCLRTASIRANEKTVVARLTRDMLLSILDKSQAAAGGLRLLIARRLMEIVDAAKP